MTDPTPQLRARLDRTQINPDHSRTAFFVVEATAPDAQQDAPRPQHPLNLGLVIDASGSMEGSTGSVEGELHPDYTQELRIAAAQRAATGVVQKLDDADVLSVVSFADDTLTHIASMPMSTGGRASSTDAIRSIQTRGCTDLNEGWLKGAEHVAHYMESHGPSRNRVLLLSDGYANRGVVEPDLLADTAKGLRDRSIYTSTVGIGMEYSTEQLEVLAEHGGGMMHHAEHAEDIVIVILAELNEMRMAALDNVEVVVSLDDGEGDDGHESGSPGSPGLAALGYPSTTEGGIVTTPMGSLVGGATRRIVYRIDVPATSQETTYQFSVSVAGLDEGGVSHTSATSQATLSLTSGRSTSRDREVALLAARAWLDETARRAMVLNRHQDYRELQFWARNELAAFNDYCVRLPGGRDLSDKMSRLFARVMRPMQERNRKEVSLSVLKSQRSIADYRETAMAEADFDLYLDDGK